MATSIRSVVGKLGRVTCHRNIRRSEAILYMPSGGSVGSAYSSRHPFDSGHHANQVLNRRIPKRENPEFKFVGHPAGIVGGMDEMCRYSPDTLLPARFAVEEFNKQKDAQLQFVRVVRASMQGMYPPYFLITIEAVDATDHHGLVKVYQAMVAKEARSMELMLFGVVVDDGSLLKLIDDRRGRQSYRGWLILRSQKVSRQFLLPRKTSDPVEDEVLSALRMLPLRC